MKGDWRFLRVNPEVWAEFLTEARRNPGTTISLRDLPSQAKWARDWGRSDWFFQNALAGKLGRSGVNFQPTWEYLAVEFHLYGYRPLITVKERRAYAERFHAVVHHHPGGTTCTFFRQHPLPNDLPPRQLGLSAFGPYQGGEEQEGNDTSVLPAAIIRERIKNLYASRPERSFNPFNGREDVMPLNRDVTGGPGSSSPALSLPPPRGGNQGKGRDRVHERGWSKPSASAQRDQPLGELHCMLIIEVVELQPPLHVVQRIRLDQENGVSIGIGPRRVFSRAATEASGSSTSSGSEESGHSSFEDEFGATRRSEREDVEMEARSEMEFIPLEESTRRSDLPFASSSHSSQADWAIRTPKLERDMRDKIEAWRPQVLEIEPPMGEYQNIQWNRGWLDQALFVGTDHRTEVRIKAIVALDPGIRTARDLLERAIRFGLPFNLYVERSRVREFRDVCISPLQLRTLSATYEPGYSEPSLTWSRAGGAQAAYGAYLANINGLLSRPEAPACIPRGGVIRFVAEVYCPDLVDRYARGPSLQVSEFDRGESRLFAMDGEESFWTADKITQSQEGVLLGLIPGDLPASDRTLWPTPDVFERESAHMRGYLSHGAYRILMKLRDDIMSTNPKLVWRTRSGWTTYFRGGRTGKNRDLDAKLVPSDKDFEEGRDLFENSYPVGWSPILVKDMEFPENLQFSSRGSEIEEGKRSPWITKGLRKREGKIERELTTIFSRQPIAFEFKSKTNPAGPTGGMYQIEGFWPWTIFWAFLDSFKLSFDVLSMESTSGPAAAVKWEMNMSGRVERVVRSHRGCCRRCREAFGTSECVGPVAGDDGGSSLGRRRPSSKTLISIEQEYATQPKLNAIGTMEGPVSWARAQEITSPPIMRRMDESEWEATLGRFNWQVGETGQESRTC
ncbi:hypothetical protein K438DRAFT_1787708 [Mycena galopus ATCC 62051]|nr:hypothetical protein K438DRAFT_1787708 [Mycena galopus ATCC 62051]